jgi:hypothetical protein
VAGSKRVGDIQRIFGGELASVRSGNTAMMGKNDNGWALAFGLGHQCWVGATHGSRTASRAIDHHHHSNSAHGGHGVVECGSSLESAAVYVVPFGHSSNTASTLRLHAVVWRRLYSTLLHQTVDFFVVRSLHPARRELSHPILARAPLQRAMD